MAVTRLVDNAARGLSSRQTEPMPARPGGPEGSAKQKAVDVRLLGREGHVSVAVVLRRTYSAVAPGQVIEISAGTGERQVMDTATQHAQGAVLRHADDGRRPMRSGQVTLAITAEN